jgi:hypothetical protein
MDSFKRSDRDAPVTGPASCMSAMAKHTSMALMVFLEIMACGLLE